MSWPESLTVYAYSHKTDGGTAVLYCLDELGMKHTIHLGQRWRPEVAGAGKLIFDGEFIIPRSGDEATVLALLDLASLRPQTEEQFGSDEYQKQADKLRDKVVRICTFVRSNSYVEFLAKIGT